MQLRLSDRWSRYQTSQTTSLNSQADNDCQFQMQTKARYQNGLSGHQTDCHDLTAMTTRYKHILHGQSVSSDRQIDYSDRLPDRAQRLVQIIRLFRAADKRFQLLDMQYRYLDRLLEQSDSFHIQINSSSSSTVSRSVQTYCLYRNKLFIQPDRQSRQLERRPRCNFEETAWKWRRNCGEF